MELKFILKNDVTKSQQDMIDSLNKICFGIDETILNNQSEGHYFGAEEAGVCVAMDDRKIIGIAYVYKRLTHYDGDEFYIGGIGGLAVAPEYRGKGYARKLVESGLKMSYEIGVDVACLFIDEGETIYQLYEKLGYVFLKRDAYYIDSLEEERTRDGVMILGLRKKELAEKILSTNDKFNYGNDEGSW